MTKEQLREGRKYRAEIEQLECLIADVEDLTRGGDLPGGAGRCGKSDPTARNAERAAELKRKLLVKKTRMLIFIDKVEDAIEKLPILHRLVMRERYINLKTFEQIAVDMNYSIQRIWQINGEALSMICKKD